jgi:hypothetical protein
VLLRLAHLGVTDAFALPRLLPMSDRDKDAEILALRHQLAVALGVFTGTRAFGGAPLDIGLVSPLTSSSDADDDDVMNCASEP